MESDFERLREAMVQQQVVERGIHSPALLAALRHVRRERFVPPGLAGQAYADRPLPIGAQQTISQPFIVAYSIEALGLRGGERVLEVGTGSGYATALLACIAGRVHSLERLDVLACSARERLAREGFANVEVRLGDGTLGWPAAAPFDAILVAAGGPRVPPALTQQLSEGGRLLIPVGVEPGLQRIVRVTRSGLATFVEEPLLDVHFVPLLGAQGWSDSGAGRDA